MENNEKRKALVIATIVCVSLLVGILGSYAFFISTGGNNSPEELSVQTGNMALTFSDGSSSFQGSLEFGSSATKTFTIENTGSIEAKGRMKWSNLINTYLEGSLTYTLSYAESEDGDYTDILTNKNVPVSETAITKTLASYLTIPVGSKYYYKLTITLNYLSDVDQTADLRAILTTNFILEESTENEARVETTLKTLNVTLKEGVPNFAEAATTDETADGLYAMADDYGTSYYYRGAVENNYVRFAGFYWRIIRVNGDGSLRIIYDGTEAYTNGTSNEERVALTSIAWNTSSWDAKFVGYMYGGTNTNNSSTKRVELGEEGYADSTNAIYNETDTNIKTRLEVWYKTNIVDKKDIKGKSYDVYVSDEIFCNDRSAPGKEETDWSGDTGLGYGTNETMYGSWLRLYKDTSNPHPQFTCPDKNDAFTKNDTTKGNEALSQKVGLITADEIIAGGAKPWTSNLNYYLYKGTWYWSLSPYSLNSYGYASGFRVDTNGLLNSTYINDKGGVAPVINLSAEYVKTLIGDGTKENPFRLKSEPEPRYTYTDYITNVYLNSWGNELSGFAGNRVYSFGKEEGALIFANETWGIPAEYTIDQVTVYSYDRKELATYYQRTWVEDNTWHARLSDYVFKRHMAPDLDYIGGTETLEQKDGSLRFVVIVKN